MTEQTARQAKQARIAELAKTAKLFPTQPDAIAWVIDHRLPEIDAQAIFLANDIEPEGQWAVIEALQKAEAKSAHAKELGAAIARHAEEGGTIIKRRLIDLERKAEETPEAGLASLKNLDVQPEAEPPEPTQSEGATEGPEWATADWDKPVEPKPKPEPQSEARLVPPELGKLVARAEPRQPLSFFQYTRTPSGIVPSFENALIALKAMKLDCRLDVFHDRVIVKGYESTANGDAAENLDNMLMKLRERILRQWGFDPGKEYLADALRTECLDHMFDPVRDSTGFGGMARRGSIVG